MKEPNGLMGQTIEIRHKRGNTESCPWDGIAVPVAIIEEYPCFYVGVVLPHHAPHGFAISQPYRITISKHDLAIEMLIIKEGR